MIITPLLLSLYLSFLVTLILFVAAFPLACWLAQSSSVRASLVEAFLSLGQVLPPSVLGFYYLLLFSPYAPLGSWLAGNFGLKLVFSFSGLVLICSFAALPHMLSALKNGWKAIGSGSIEAARSMNRSWPVILWRIILPQMKSALASGAISCFTTTLGSFGLVLMVGGSIPGSTRLVSIAIFEEFEAGRMETAHLYSALLLLIGFASAWMLQQLQRKTRRR